MTNLYEGMFLVDNQLVRQNWDNAKKVVTGLLEKHGATVKSARRWDERRLAYPIKRKNRATFLLTYSEIPNEGIASLRRDLELNEDVLRYLFLRAEEVPQEEIDATVAEGSDDFVVPLPPEDHELDEEETPDEKASGDSKEKAEKGEKSEDGEAPKEGEAKAEGEGEEAKAEATEKTEESTETPEKKDEA